MPIPFDTSSQAARPSFCGKANSEFKLTFFIYNFRGELDRSGIQILLLKSWLGEIEQRDKWSFCLTAAMMAAKQERL
jgi:hypothetical protein